MKIIKRGFVAVTVLSAIIVGAYFGGKLFYNGKFLPNTFIDGTEVSFMNTLQADEAYKHDHYNYPIVLKADSETFNVTDKDMDWSTFEGSEPLLSNVNFEDFFISMKHESNYVMAVGDVPAQSAEKILKAWGLITNINAVKSQNAYVEYNNGWVIVPEVRGTEINVETAKKIIASIVSFKSENKNLADFPGFYKEAEIKRDDPIIINFRDALDKATNKTITYTFNGEIYQITQKDLVPYTEFSNNSFTYSVDYEKFATDYINNLASKVNTLGTTRKFKTTLGDFIDIDGGNWGWKLDNEKTTAALVQQLTDADFVAGEGKLEWTQTASENSGIDIRNYVEIDLSNQKLYMYKGNELILSTDITSGNPNHGNNTPGGVFRLTYKTRNTRLKGPTWNVAVKYWMPFNGGIGMHDASWRSKFGGDNYKIDGSHGCINMPTAAAKTVYDNIDSSYAIICFWRT